MIEIQQLLFVIGITTVFFGFFWALHQTRIKLYQTQAELLEIKNTLVAIKSTGIGQGKRIIDVDSKLKKIGNTQPLNQPSKLANKNYQQATKMLSMGIEAEEIMDCCGLTKGEIQLLMQLNTDPQNSKSFH